MNRNKKIIYFDNAATTKISTFALNEMKSYIYSDYGNPSALYDLAKKNRSKIEECRRAIAKIIGASAEEIIFTSGGSESDNLAIKGIYLSKLTENKNAKYNIVTSKIEHKAILNSCEIVKKLGCEVRYVSNDSNGIININELSNLIDKNTILCSIMTINNELGTLEPLNNIVKICKSKKILFHTDAVQAIGHLNINVKKIGIDLLSASAHKFNGPKGIGFIYKRKGIKIASLISGGSQEYGLRAGTENVAGIVGMATALEENIGNINKNENYITKLRNHLIFELERLRESDKDFDYRYNCKIENSFYSHLNISFKCLEAENVVNILNLHNICISSGSACNSKSRVVSHVLKAIKCPKEYINGAIRITLSKYNTKKEIDIFVKELYNIIKKINQRR
ncbi:MAG: cysteine desulfurase [Lachnospiraceae bacterium]|nr:cysteine desulfurase [Lachnospiraceae bacterium]